MRFIIAFFRFIVAFFAIFGTWKAWTLTDPNSLIYFTTQTNIIIGLVFLWAAIAELTHHKQPPVWLKGSVLLYILITGLVAHFILDPPDPNLPRVFLGLTTTDMVHIVTPILTSVDFLFFANHRKLKLRHAMKWLLYPIVYFIFILLLVGAYPAIGYPYPFIDLTKITVNQLLINVVTYLIGFCLLGGIIVFIDHFMPPKPLLRANSEDNTLLGRVFMHSGSEMVGVRSQDD